MTKKELEQENAELNWTITVCGKAIQMLLEELGFALKENIDIEKESYIWLGRARDELLSNDDVEEIDVDKL